MLTLLAVPFQLRARVPHRIQHRDWAERSFVLIVKFLERPIHFTAHTSFFPLGLIKHQSGTIAGDLGFANCQSSGDGAGVAIMLFAKKMGLEKGIMDEGL